MLQISRILAGRTQFFSVVSRQISTTQVNCLFWERDPKSGYGKKVKYNLDLLKGGWENLKRELRIFKQEVITHWESDPIITYQPGVQQKLWGFQSEEDLKVWTTTADSDHAEGFSKCSFTIPPGSRAHFAGVLSAEVPKDGAIKRSGYCSIRTHRARKSFKRDSYWDWSNYTHLVIRCRGDGRTYMVNVYSSGYFDQLWNDTYHYPLYTRGGPYWQTTRIPFSKFFFASKGRIQDIQNEVDLERISHFGITAADSYNGSFKLEIDYIALLSDPSETEAFAYENYRIPKGLAAT